MKNETFFDEITTEEAAYWLGFITADGNLHRNGYNTQINLSRRDRVHLEKLGSELGQPVKDIDWEKDGKVSKGCYLSLSSARTWKSLRRLGLCPNKTESEQAQIWRKIPAKLRHHFLRGLFDGDGCVTSSKTHSKLCGTSFSGEHSLIMQVRDFLCEELGLGRVKPSIQPRLTVVTWSGKRQAAALQKYLYQNASVFLERKRIKFEEISTSRSKGKYFGVTRARSGKWNSSICLDGKRVHIGNFDSAEAAARAHDAVGRKHGKPAYKLNFQE